MTEQDDLQTVAFYYPGHLWRSPRWIKSLLLFFDGIGLLIPEYKQGEPEAVDPVLAGPLSDQGLLHYLVADEIVDEEATRKLTTALAQVIESGALDSLGRDGSAFHELSMSRMGYYGERALADNLFQELKARDWPATLKMVPLSQCTRLFDTWSLCYWHRFCGHTAHVLDWILHQRRISSA